MNIFFMYFSFLIIIGLFSGMILTKESSLFRNTILIAGIILITYVYGAATNQMLF